MRYETDKDSIRKYVFWKLIICITAFISLFLISGNISFTYDSSMNGRAKRVEVSLKGGVPEDKKLIGLQNIGMLESDISGNRYSYANDMDAFARVGEVMLPVEVCLTKHNYIQYAEGKIVKGIWFNADACANGRNVAVISASLAEKLFHTYEVIGNQIELFDEKYKIVGLFQREESLISLLGADGNDKVFVPFQSHSLAGKMPFQRILIKGEAVEKEGFRVHAIEELLEKRLGIDVKDYKVSDFYDGGVFVSQMQGIIVLVIGIWCICILFAHFVRFVKMYIRRLESDLKDMYFPDIVKWRKYDIGKLFLYFTAFAGCAAGICLLIGFKLIIPPEYIPQYNIFDIQFYMDKIKEAIFITNSSYGYIPSELELYFTNALLLNGIISILFLFAFISLISVMKLARLVGMGVQNLLKIIVISFSAAFLISILFSIASGILFTVQANLLVLIYFLFLSSLRQFTEKSMKLRFI